MSLERLSAVILKMRWYQAGTTTHKHARLTLKPHCETTLKATIVCRSSWSDRGVLTALCYQAVATETGIWGRELGWGVRWKKRWSNRKEREAQWKLISRLCIAGRVLRGSTYGFYRGISHTTFLMNKTSQSVLSLKNLQKQMVSLNTHIISYASIRPYTHLQSSAHNTNIHAALIDHLCENMLSLGLFWVSNWKLVPPLNSRGSEWLSWH